MRAIYLKRPILLSTSKKTIFLAMKDIIWKNIQGQTENLLSQVQEEVLLKAIVQAISIYILIYFKMMDNVVEEINSMITRFWWGVANDKKKIQLKGWTNIFFSLSVIESLDLKGQMCSMMHFKQNRLKYTC